MAVLSSFFKQDATTYKARNIVLYKFDDSRSAEFIKECLVPFRLAYISDKDLDYNVSIDGTRAEEIKKLLPTKPNLKSGDFGEILTFYVAQKLIYPDSNFHPLKWRWKEGADSPCHFTDIVFFKRVDSDPPRKDDYVATFEVKCGATIPAKGKSRIEDSIIGAAKDADGRLAKTLLYFEKHYKQDKNEEDFKCVKRFENAATAPYNTFISAVAIVEKVHLDTHINNITKEAKSMMTKRHIAVVVMPIAKLKDIYEEVYRKIPTT